MHGNVLMIIWCYMPSKQGVDFSHPLAPVAVTQVHQPGRTAVADAAVMQVNQPKQTAAEADVSVTRVDQPVWTAAADGDAVQQEWPAPEHPASPSRRHRGPAAKPRKTQACGSACHICTSSCQGSCWVTRRDIRVAHSAPFTRRRRKLRFNRSGSSRTTAAATSQRRRCCSHASGATYVWLGLS